MADFKRTVSLESDDGGIILRNKPEEERLRTVIAFLIFGIIIYTIYSLLLAGAQDILAGTVVPTSTILAVIVLPCFLVNLAATYFMQKIPFIARIITFGCAAIGGLLLLALAKQIHWKLVGAGLASIASSFGELTVLGLTSFYHEVTSTAFSAGTGIGFVTGPLYYTAMTTWACISPNVTILIMAGITLSIFVCYYIMDKKHLGSPSPPTDDHVGVQYTALVTKDDGCHKSTEDDNTGIEGSTKENTRDNTLRSCQEVSVLIQKLLPYLIPVFIAWFSEYVTIQAVITTLAFPSAPFNSRDHYEYYIFVFMGGEVVGRSYLIILSYIKAEWAEKAKFPYLWFLSATEALLLHFLVLAAWYRFLPSVWIVFLLLFICGTVVGVAYVNAVILFRSEFKGRDKELAMGYFIVAIGAGICAAAFIGLYIEPIIREHCTMLVNNIDFCFTRSMSLDGFSKSCVV